MKPVRLILPTLILLIATAGLAACIPAVSEPTAETTPTITPSPTAIPTSTPTAAPTASPTPTFTPTPTPVTLPVTNGTPIPDLPYEVITAENVQRLREIARYGYPRLLDKNPYRLTADGKTIVVGTTLGLEFYDARTQAKTGGFEVEFLRDLDLTPNGQYLLTLAGEGVLTVWTRDGEKVQALDLPIGDAWALKSVAISPDGKLLAVQRKKADWQETDKVDVYRVADGSLLDTVRGEGAVFSPDGQYLATVFDGSVRLYPVAELGEGWEKRLPKQSLPWCGVMEGSCGLVFSPDGTLAAVVRAGQVDVYRVEDRKLVRQVSGWEADQYALPQVQFGVDGGQMVITTPALYDGQGNVRVKAQAILVDIASGEWVSKNEVEEGFAYWDGEQMRAFRWQAEGEMPEFYNYPITVKIENNRLVLRKFIEYRVKGRCVQEVCEIIPFESINDIPVYDENLNEYILRFSGGWSLVQGDEYVRLKYYKYGYPRATIRGNLFVMYNSISSFESEIVVFEKSTGKILYKSANSDFSVWNGKVYIWEQDNFVEISNHDGQTQIVKNEYPDTCKNKDWFDTLEYTFCVNLGVEQHLYPDQYGGVPEFYQIDSRLIVTMNSDGFIRVWGVVAEGANVR